MQPLDPDPHKKLRTWIQMEILKIMGPDPHKNYADPKH